MKAASKNIDIADYYFSILSNLNADSKRELIARLSSSLKQKSTKKEIPLESLFGAFESNQTAEEIITEIKKSRTFNRDIEEL